MHTRLAPTPSGYLHAGNAVNLLITTALARSTAATVQLRIDDMDVERYRPEYVDDIFSVLAWLGISWDVGPRDRAEFESGFRLADRTSQYRERLESLTGSGLQTYACGCSRSQAHAAGTRGCVGDCRDAALLLEPGRTALRAHIPVGTVVHVGDQSVDLHAEFGDPVLWRRDDLPAYHLASLDEDLRAGVTDIVRGIDLLPSTALQGWLASHSPDAGLSEVNVWHHPLLTGPDGIKLSKSQLGADPLPRTGSERDRLRGLAAVLAAGLAPQRVVT